MSRSARIERATGESKVVVEVDIDGTGHARVSTGVPFYDHMLESLARATSTSTHTTPSRTSP